MSKPFTPITGLRFGRLTVVGLKPIVKYTPQGKHVTYWECLCSCGTKLIIQRGSLVRGSTISCGCYSVERSTTHNMSRSRLYYRWSSMKQRCSDPNIHNYADYGGRGIKVCERWMKFENFLQDMGEPPSSRHTLERKNNNKGYEPDNVYWATPEQNHSNKRSNINITVGSETKTLTQWARIAGITKQSLRSRLKAGWSPFKAVYTPRRKMVNLPGPRR